MAKQIKAVDLEAQAILASADAQSIADMQSYVEMIAESAKLDGVIAQAKVDNGECKDFGFRAIRDMRVRGMSYEGIKALWKAVSQGANLPGMLKVSCSMLQNGERLGLKITAETTRADCAKAIKAEKEKSADVADKASADNQQGTTDGELTDAQVIKQAFALLSVNADLRQMYAADFAKISAKLAADSAKIAAGKLADGAAAAAARKAA